MILSVRMQEEYERPTLPLDGREGLVLFFTVGNQVFGIRLTEVSHIESFRAADEEPAGPEADDEENLILWGIEPAGSKIPAVNLHKFLGIDSAGPGRAGQVQERILIIFREADERFGLRADGVKAIVPGHQVSEMTYPKLLGEEGEKVFGGFFSLDKRLIPALNPDYIWNSACPEGQADSR